MNDRIFRDLALAVAGGLIVWFLTQHQKNKAAISSMVPDITPAGYNMPQENTYTPSMGLQPAINVNIGNQGLNYLDSKLIPMFGFVGMAQNGMYQ